MSIEQKLAICLAVAAGSWLLPYAWNWIAKIKLVDAIKNASAPGSPVVNVDSVPVEQSPASQVIDSTAMTKRIVSLILDARDVAEELGQYKCCDLLDYASASLFVEQEEDDE